ncbi:hypothetical protein A2U01_0066974, partial [Trifolium medium]|nr:hypothetical protein [Trifolium medium]
SISDDKSVRFRVTGEPWRPARSASSSPRSARTKMYSLAQRESRRSATNTRKQAQV